jgi:hypothetical protein
MQCETVQGGLHGNKLIAQTAVKMWRQGRLMPFYRECILHRCPADTFNWVEVWQGLLSVGPSFA